MKKTFLAISSAGPNRDFSKATREQPFWYEHAKFIDQLVENGLIYMGGALDDDGCALPLSRKNKNRWLDAHSARREQGVGLALREWSLSAHADASAQALDSLLAGSPASYTSSFDARPSCAGCRDKFRLLDFLGSSS